MTLSPELQQALGVACGSLSEGIDATTPAGKLQLHILGTIADYAVLRITRSLGGCGSPSASRRGYNEPDRTAGD
ncbi:MAG TPA: hypothetical protein VIK32_07220 [Candidatus Limnocylindrales bacterium]